MRRGISFKIKKLTEEESQFYLPIRDHFARFVTVWQTPFSQWLKQTTLAASSLDKIRLLRNLAIHEDAFYRWQYLELRAIVCGGQTSDDRVEKGILFDIYG
ncbi:MAG: hypothetical protein CV045_09970 [Cyanobacteria bacterium M5B4]|nr:MAG: hypothetical protein CV045_09970 [Cyanobacteria bacterium M5B4]